MPRSDSIVVVMGFTASSVSLGSMALFTLTLFVKVEIKGITTLYYEKDYLTFKSEIEIFVMYKINHFKVINCSQWN